MVINTALRWITLVYTFWILNMHVNILCEYVCRVLPSYLVSDSKFARKWFIIHKSFCLQYGSCNKRCFFLCFVPNVYLVITRYMVFTNRSICLFLRLWNQWKFKSHCIFITLPTNVSVSAIAIGKQTKQITCFWYCFLLS